MRSRKLVWGPALSAVSLAAQMTAVFLLMPLMIRAYGDMQFGLWVLALPFMGYAGGLNLGLYAAANRFLSRAIGSGGPAGDRDIRDVSATAFYLFIFLAFFWTLAVLGVSCAAPMFLNGDAQIRLFRELLLILCVYNGLVFPTAVFENTLAAHLRYDLIYGTRTLGTLARVLLTIFLIRHGHGLIGVAWGMAACGIAEAFLEVLLSRAVEKRTSVLPRHFHWARARQMFDYGFYAVIGKLGDLLRFRADAFVVTFFSGVRFVTPFRIASGINEYFHQFMGGLTGIFNPYFSQEEGRNNLEGIREKFLFVTKITAFVAAFAGALAVGLGRDFLERWIGPGHAIAYPLLLILILPNAFVMAQGPVFPLVYGISKHRFMNYVNLGEGILNLLLSVLLAPTMGVFGVAWGTAIPMLITAVVIQPLYVVRALEIPLGRYGKAFLTPFFTSAAVLLVSGLVMAPYLAPTYPSLLFFGAVQTAVFIPFVFYLGFNKHERDHLVAALGNRSAGKSGAVA
ncbi:MAG: oligosaccharide flippase family protein [Candidatus Omnitrophica bacterium]|nr:oligosaccharide flippase family protein [Candidatus Omnitrophota bacterium]